MWKFIKNVIKNGFEEKKKIFIQAKDFYLKLHLINKILVLIGISVFFYFSFTYMSNKPWKDIQSAYKYKQLIEESYVDGKFNLPKKVVEENIRYDVFVENNSIVIDYNITAERSVALRKNYINAYKTENGFEWKCRVGITQIERKCK